MSEVPLYSPLTGYPRPCGGPRGGAVSYDRGTPVEGARVPAKEKCVLGMAVWVLSVRTA